MEKFRVYGASTKEESQRERDHRALARRAAAEGIVLMKNDGVLPLKTKTVALYGAGARMTVFGGVGSGDTHARYNVSVEQGLKNAGITVLGELGIERFEQSVKSRLAAWKAELEEKAAKYSPIRTMDMFIMIGEHPKPQPGCAPVLSDELTDKTDTALYILARQAGEGGDRRNEKGDYLLSDEEEKGIKLLSSHYKKLILVINSGGVVDLSILDKCRIDAVLFMGQPGMEAGNALADILTGKISPSGKLTDTWAMRYEDYPSADTYSHINGETDFENYFEGIYVGYRYFDSFGVKPRFPFGFGMSYTTFEHSVQAISVKKTEVTVQVKVQNTGMAYSGKEVIQLYLQKPAKAQDCEEKSLVAFGKTASLACGKAETLSLCFDMAKQGSFDEERNCFVLEPGDYGLLVGTNSENAKLCSVLTLDKEVITETVPDICPKPCDFADMKSRAKPHAYSDALPRYALKAEDFAQTSHKEYLPKFSEKVRTVLSRLSDGDKISLVVGGGYSVKCFNNVMGAAGRTATNLLKKGIPNIVLADGPAGLNVNQAIVVMLDGTPRYPEGLPEDWQWGWLKKIGWLVKAKPGKGRPVYNYMTAWPSATVQAQSWNQAIVEEIGAAVGKEMLEIGVSVWLAPGMNIHRNPLCGRNFEYYSEDPLIAGKMAAAVTRGVQSMGGVGVCIKHFLCNNQEENRTMVSENLSQRALREIYLRAFRIAIEEGRPWTVMSSYNRINGLHVVNDAELLTGVLRDEWGFEGLVMSDWNAAEQCSYSKAINAGNDLIMPGTSGVRKSLEKALKDGSLDRNALDISAARVLSLVFNSAAAEGF